MACRGQDQAVISSIGTVLLVAITAAMMVIVGVFVMGLAKFDEAAPELEVVTSNDMGSLRVHVNSVTEARPTSEFRLIATASNGSVIMYDSDGDAVADAALSHDLSLLSVDSATGPQMTPLVYVDVDHNGRVSSGDYITYRYPYFPPLSPFIDATHGYKVVKQAPSGIPRDSMMLVVASPGTLAGSDLVAGDTVRVEISKGGVVFHTEEGQAAVGGIYTTTIDIPMSWVPATYAETRITVRPDEGDEWSMLYPFKVLPENPPSKAEQAYWKVINNPVVDGSRIVLVHKPTNTVVLELTV